MGHKQTAGHVLKRSAMLSKKPWLGVFLCFLGLEPQSSVCDTAAPSSSVVGESGRKELGWTRAFVLCAWEVLCQQYE